MKFEELIKLIEVVGRTGLSDFEYEEEGVRIWMSAGGGKRLSMQQTGQGLSAGGLHSAGRKYQFRESAPGHGRRVMDKDAAVKDESARTPHFGALPVGQQKETPAESEKEVIEVPVEGIFHFTDLSGNPLPLQLGDQVKAGQVLGTLDSRGRCFEVVSVAEGEVTDIYIEDGEELVAREPMFRVLK